MLQQAIKNSLETNEKIENFRKETEITKKRNGNNGTKKINK